MDLRIPENRVLVLKDIKTPENKDRKDKSFEATEIYNYYNQNPIKKEKNEEILQDNYPLV